MLITDEIKEFSNQLVKELGIDLIDFDENLYESGEIQWHTPNFIIYPESRPHPKRWVHLLEVIPKSSSCNMCSLKFFNTYNISEYMEEDILSWHYKFNGTKTENLPSKQFRYTILEELKKYNIREVIHYYDDATWMKKIILCTNADEVRKNILAERITSRFDIIDL